LRKDFNLQMICIKTEIFNTNLMLTHFSRRRFVSSNMFNNVQKLLHFKFPSEKIDCRATRRLEPFSWFISLTFRDDQQCQVEREIHVISVCMFCAGMWTWCARNSAEANEHCRTYINISNPTKNMFQMLEIHFHMLNA
jgi:hypothetical protein